MQGGRTIDSVLYTLRTEMCFQANSIDYFRGSGRDVLGGPMPTEPIMPLGVVRLLPDGWVDYNGTVGFEMTVSNYLEPLQASGIPGLLSGLTKQNEDIANLKTQFCSKFRFALVLNESPVQDLLRNICCATMLDQQAVAAIALEQFFLRHQVYPETLKQVVPEFLPTVPLDFMNNRELGYRRTEDNRYMLWSVGFDGVDDGGKVTIDLPKVGTARSLYSFDYKGDWVWRYTAVRP